MKKKTAKRFSLKSGLLAMILACWLIPIVIVLMVAGAFFERTYSQTIEQEIDFSAQKAMEQVQSRLEEAIAASKSVSYDGLIRQAYQSYTTNGDRAELYLQTNDYLRIFTRTSLYKGVIVHYWEDSVAVSAYHLTSGTTGIDLIHKFQKRLPDIMEQMGKTDTMIRFLSYDGELYMVRNLLDMNFQPYASVIMLLDADTFFRPISAVVRVENVSVWLDGNPYRLREDSFVPVDWEESRPVRQDLYSTRTVDGHVLALTGTTEEFNPWTENPWILFGIGMVVLMVLPLMIIVVRQYYKNVTSPMEILADANARVESGKRGYQITAPAPNREFEQMFRNFNTMSGELENQFQRAYQEQRATQRAEMKALQSQINPHFLNNTLEIINWEARMAGDDRVSAMIESLSTMLKAALDRNGRTKIPLSEELGYVDAYLYIIRERLGEGFRVHKDIDESILALPVPRLVLQPLVENAVEHDITANRGGDLWVRAYRQTDKVVLEVEHDGTLTQEDRQKIQSLLAQSVQGAAAGGLGDGVGDDAQQHHAQSGKIGLHVAQQPQQGLSGVLGFAAVAAHSDRRHYSSPPFCWE
mgnify:CR=1 FL=1